MTDFEIIRFKPPAADRAYLFARQDKLIAQRNILFDSGLLETSQEARARFTRIMQDLGRIDMMIRHGISSY